jgi:hypothetical protein
MVHLALFSAAGVVVVAWGFGALRHRRPRAEHASGPSPPPASFVRVLRSEDELKKAVDRAACFEQMVAGPLLARRGRHEAAAWGAGVLHAAPGGSPAAPLADDETCPSA